MRFVLLQQYWFSNNTINVLSSLVKTDDYDGVLCIGAPRVFECVRSRGKPSFLLDVDTRFVCTFLHLHKVILYRRISTRHKCLRLTTCTHIISTVAKVENIYKI